MKTTNGVFDFLAANAATVFLAGTGADSTPDTLAEGQIGITTVGQTLGAFAPGSLVDSSVTPNNGATFRIVEGNGGDGLIKSAIFEKGNIISIVKKNGAAATEQQSTVDLTGAILEVGDDIKLEIELTHDKEMFSLRSNNKPFYYRVKAGDTATEVADALAALVNADAYMQGVVTASAAAGIITLDGVALRFKGGRSAGDLRHYKVTFDLRVAKNRGEGIGAVIAKVATASYGNGTFQLLSVDQFASHNQPVNRVDHPFEEGNYDRVLSANAEYTTYMIKGYASAGPKTKGGNVAGYVPAPFTCEIALSANADFAAAGNVYDFEQALEAVTGVTIEGDAKVAAV